jgi:hypothetical protein
LFVFTRLLSDIDNARAMKKLSFSGWLARTERVIAGALAEILPRDWDENDATKSWMRALRRDVSEVEIIDLGRPYAVAWDTVKLKGKAENFYGDIGILVRMRYPNGVQTEGVGFIEAKRIYASGRYQELKSDQLQRMLKAVPHHRLGLYEQSPIEEAAYGLAGHGVLLDPESYSTERSRWYSVVAAVVPTAVALYMDNNRRADLHPPCLPLSYQLCARYLGGYDLDYAPKLTVIVRNGGAGAPSWLLIADVRMGGETTPSTEGLLPAGPGSPYTSLEPDVEATREVEAEAEVEEEEEEAGESEATQRTMAVHRIQKQC